MNGFIFRGTAGRTPRPAKARARAAHRPRGREVVCQERLRRSRDGRCRRARAGLAVGTIYNYFPSKSALLLAIIRRESESLLARGRKILDDPPRDAVAAACAFTEIFLDDFTRDDRRLWRELFGAAIADPSVVGRRLFEGDAQLVSQLASLLEQISRRRSSRIGP